jgi:hypothetical protein
MQLAKSLCVALAAACLLALPLEAAAGHDEDGPRVKHVLLISVDGMHALDLTNYVAAHPNSTLAQLSAHGKTFTNASTPYISDSFPGLAALVTGGSPITAGLWYDVSYNRKLSPPKQTTLNGIPGGANLCPGTVGAPFEYDEGVDFDLTRLDAGGGIDGIVCRAIPATAALRFSRISICASTPSSTLLAKPGCILPGSINTRPMSG